MVGEEVESPIKTLRVVKEIVIAAPAAVVFETLLEPHGPMKEMNMKLEAWPGGRWFRDLGNNAGHLWGHVQVIKPPKLLEMIGPMMTSYPVTHHIQYRLTPEGEGTRLTLTHRSYGYYPKDFIQGVDQGWSWKNKRIEEIAMRLKAARKGGGR